MKVSAFIKRKIAKAKGGSGRRRTSASDPGDDVAAAAGLHRHSKKNLQVEVDNGNGPPSHSHRRQTEGTEDTISLSMLIGDDNLSSEACEAGKINSEFGSSRPSRLDQPKRTSQFSGPQNQGHVMDQLFGMSNYFHMLRI